MSPSLDRKVERFFLVRKIFISNSKMISPNTDAMVTEKRDAGVNGEPILVSKKIIKFIGSVSILIGFAKPPNSLAEFNIAILYAKIVKRIMQAKNIRFL